MKVNGDLQMLETEWEELDSIQLNSPTQIQKHLTDTKVGLIKGVLCLLIALAFQYYVSVIDKRITWFSLAA